MTAPLVPYRHPGAGFTLPLPEQWGRAEDVQGVALVAIEPDRGPWFRANVVVTIEQLDPRLDLAAWQEHSLALLREALNEFYLIDVEETAVGGRPARRTLAHHRTEHEHTVNAVTMEQWTIREGELGYTLTGSVATLEYDELADTFARLAGEFRPDPGYVP